MFELVGHWGGGNVWRVSSGEFISNAYLCGTEDNRCVLIDGGLDPVSIGLSMQKLLLIPSAVFCTHGHFDHAGSAAFFQRKYKIPVFLHSADHKLLRSSNFLLMAFKLASRIEQPSKITAVISGQMLDVAGYTLTFHGAPGHTPGSCVIELGTALFTGDTIYKQGVGLSNLPGEKPDILKQSIMSLWPLLTAGRTVYPGHGDCGSGAEVRATNRDLLNFLGLFQSRLCNIKAKEL